MPAIGFARFRVEIEAIYRETRAKRTADQVRQIGRELAGVGARSTRDLTPATVARWIATRTGGNPVTTKSLLGVVRAVCTYAAGMGYVRCHPFEVLPIWIDAEPEEVPRHLARAEVARLLAHLEAEATTWTGARLHALAATVAYTGVRRGEALNLRVEDLDLPSGLLRVARRRRRWRPKTKKSAAILPVPDRLRPTLEHWAGRCGSPWLFPGVKLRGPWTGGPPGKRPLDALRRAGIDAGIGPVNFQVLRHSWATHAGYWGLSDLDVKQQLRHTTIRTARDHYIHPDIANLAEKVQGISYGETG